MDTLEEIYDAAAREDVNPFLDEGRWDKPRRSQLAILALGASRTAWEIRMMDKSSEQGSEEDIDVWTVNRGAHLWHHDKAFVLDDLLREFEFDPGYRERLNSFAEEIIVSHLYDPDKVGVTTPMTAYPLAQMGAWCFHHKLLPYFKNSVPMMVALGIAMGYKTIFLHGADYTMPNGQLLEHDRSNLEYWIGVASARGVMVGVPNGSTLLSSHEPLYKVYGYDRIWESKQALDHGAYVMRVLHGKQMNAEEAPDPIMPEVGQKTRSALGLRHPTAKMFDAAKRGCVVFVDGVDYTVDILRGRLIPHNFDSSVEIQEPLPLAGPSEA